jgi:hypothetical protein
MTRFLWLLPLSFLLYACPFESNVPLEKNPVEPIDSSLIGYWYGIIKDGSDYFGIEALEISRQSDSLYSVIRYGKTVKGDMILPDTAYFTAYSSWIRDQHYMNVMGKSPDGGKQEVYYLTAFSRSRDTLHVRTITETFTARKSFPRPEDLKKLVLDMSQNRNIFDDLYTLSYRKIPKPASFEP